MLSVFLDKASGLLNRRFLVAWWFPTFIAGVAALLLGVTPYGLTSAWQWWQQQDGSVQTWLLFGGLLLVTLFAYLLQVLTRPLMRLYEGYWPHRVRRWFRKSVEKRWQRWRRERAEAAKDDFSRYAILQDRLHHEYPPQAEQLLPTRLGNVLRSAENYPITAYGMDAIFWWSRLWPLLPEATQKGIEDEFTPVLALLNLATLVGVVAISGAIYLLRAWVGWWQPSAVLLGGVFLSWAAYRGAALQARSYGQCIRAAVDLYRFDLLKALHQPLPATPQEERALWKQLIAWLYNQDRGAVQGLTYHHGNNERKTLSKKVDDRTKSTGFWGFVRRFWGGG
jgi:hypothetical protein